MYSISQGRLTCIKKSKIPVAIGNLIMKVSHSHLSSVQWKKSDLQKVSLHLIGPTDSRFFHCIALSTSVINVCKQLRKETASHGMFYTGYLGLVTSIPVRCHLPKPRKITTIKLREATQKIIPCYES